MAGGKGGSQTVKVPKFVEEAGKKNLARADEIAQLGFVRDYTPDVAAFTPMQQAAFANTGQAAGAFGLSGGGMTGVEGMPVAQDYGGVSAYSSAPLYDLAVQELQARAPAQYDFIRGMFIDPVTGERPLYPFGPQAAPVAAGGGTGGGGGGGGGYGGYQGEGYGPDPLGAERAASLGRGGGIFDTHQGPNPNGQAGYGLGGFTSFGDMFDGGGPGRSGGGFRGGFWG